MFLAGHLSQLIAGGEGYGISGLRCRFVVGAGFMKRVVYVTIRWLLLSYLSSVYDDRGMA